MAKIKEIEIYFKEFKGDAIIVTASKNLELKVIYFNDFISIYDYNEGGFFGRNYVCNERLTVTKKDVKYIVTKYGNQSIHSV